jgi:diphthamide synthase (EF-2-diphthine--ammonia ligase)
MNLLDDLPPAVDPCGERGEFHTFCHAGPMFTRPIIIRVGAPIERGAFCYAEPSLATKAPARP